MRVLVVDDNAIIRLGLRLAFEEGHGFEVFEAADAESALRVFDEIEPDAVLLDVQMPKRSGLTLVRSFAERCTVLMLTNTTDQATVDDALAQGASGYIVHGTLGAGEIVGSLVAARGGATVLAGVGATAPHPTATEGRASLMERYELSLREAEVMEYVALGYSNRDIAGMMFISEKTVKNHLSSIFRRLGVTSRTAAVSLWLGNGRTPGGP